MRRTRRRATGSPWSSQLRTASTRWSNSVCVAHSWNSRGEPWAHNRPRRAHRGVAELVHVARELRFARGVTPQRAGSRRGTRARPTSSARVAPPASRPAAMFSTNSSTWRSKTLLEHRAVQGFLRGEVPVHDQLGDACGAGDRPPSRSRRTRTARTRGTPPAGSPQRRAGSRWGRGTGDRLGCHGVTLAFTLRP